MSIVLNRRSQDDSPCDSPQGVDDVGVVSKVVVDDVSENSTEDGIHDDVRRVQEGHHGTESGDIGVLGGYGRSSVDVI